MLQACIGDPALSFIRGYLPKVSGDLKLMPRHHGTAFRVVYYHSGCAAWWPLRDMLEHLSLQTRFNAANPDQQHFLHQVVWNSNMFTALSQAIVRQILLEIMSRREKGLEDPVLKAGEQLVFVGFTLARLKSTFQLLINGLLSWEVLQNHFGLEGSGLEPGMVSVRLANDSTGPNFLYGHVVRHPRYKDAGATRWTDLHDLQTEGEQVNENLQYIQLTRASKDLTFWVHAEPLGSARRPKELDIDRQPPKLQHSLSRHQQLI